MPALPSAAVFSPEAQSRVWEIRVHQAVVVPTVEQRQHFLVGISQAVIDQFTVAVVAPQAGHDPIRAENLGEVVRPREKGLLRGDAVITKSTFVEGVQRLVPALNAVRHRHVQLLQPVVAYPTDGAEHLVGDAQVEAIQLLPVVAETVDPVLALGIAMDIERERRSRGLPDILDLLEGAFIDQLVEERVLKVDHVGHRTGGDVGLQFLLTQLAVCHPMDVELDPHLFEVPIVVGVVGGFMAGLEGGPGIERDGDLHDGVVFDGRRRPA